MDEALSWGHASHKCLINYWYAYFFGLKIYAVLSLKTEHVPRRFLTEFMVTV